MKNNWKKIKLKEICHFQNGKSIKPGGSGKYPVFGSNGLIGNSDEFQHKKGIIIGRVGAYCGAVMQSKIPFWASDNTIVAKPINDRINFGYSYYLFKYLDLNRFAGGSAQPLLTQTVLKQVEVKLPKIELQKKIASILSAYDELIENNKKRIKILEEMAHTIYKEWFVNFKFPGHKNVKMLDSELGQIPEGWEVLKLTKEVDFQRGVEPGSDNYMKKYKLGLVPFLRVGDFSSTPSDIYISEELAKGRILDNRDIAITLDGTVGIVKMGKKGAYSSGIQKVIIKKNSILTWSFLYCLLKSSQIQNTIKKHASGTTILHAASSKKYIKLIKPPKKLIDDFENTVGNLLRLRLNLQEKNKTLKRTRDILLPKLISGEIDVSDLDIEVIE